MQSAMDVREKKQMTIVSWRWIGREIDGYIYNTYGSPAT
jgi:hypothetical protein